MIKKSIKWSKKSIKWLKKSIFIEKVDLYQKSWLKSIYFKFFNTIIVQIRIESIRRVNRTAGMGWKKSIKSRFEYDLKRNLAQGQSNRISLVGMQSSKINLKVQSFWVFSVTVRS